MRRALQTLSFPIVGITSLAFAHAALTRGVDPELIPLLATLGAFAVVLPLERVLPRIGRPAEEGETRADLTWLAISGAVGDPLGHAAAIALATWVLTLLPDGLASELPLALGTLGVLGVASFGDYWAHRLGHEVGWWWKLHAVHHAPHRMVALNNTRLHPVDLVLKSAFQLVPVLILGFSPAAVALFGVVKGVQVAFQHADVDFRHGWLNHWIATNSVHRWHHSALASEANNDYGAVLVVWDKLFGTFFLPPEDRDPSVMGLFDEGRYPIHVISRSIVAPICWRRCVTDPG